MRAYELRVGKRGLIALPREIQEANGLQEGDTVTLVDLGSVLVLSRRRSQVDEIADRLADEWSAHGETLETMLDALVQLRDSTGATP